MLDGNEVFSPDDMWISDTYDLLGYLGTPRGTVEEYTQIPGFPRNGKVMS